MANRQENKQEPYMIEFIFSIAITMVIMAFVGIICIDQWCDDNEYRGEQARIEYFHGDK